MSASLAPAASRLRIETPQRTAKAHPGFFATIFRITAVLGLTATALVGGILYQAHKACPRPCAIGGIEAIDAMREQQKSPQKALPACRRDGTRAC